MPNGGSDCCGTCWFNSKNEGEPGYHGSRKAGNVVCTIRNVEIEDPFYTYCINHPHHNPKKIDVPLGAVYVGEDRELWLKGTDDENTRKSLLKLLSEMDESPMNEYPFGRGLDEEIIIRIGELKEIRAINDLKRIVSFNPFAEPNNNQFNRDRIITIAVAIEALGKINYQSGKEEISKLIGLGLEKYKTKNYEPKNDTFAPIRYHAIRGLKFTDDSSSIQCFKSLFIFQVTGIDLRIMAI